MPLPTSCRFNHPGNDLLPTEIAALLPGHRTTEGQADPLVRLKLFTPDSSWTWYVLEYDPTERQFFGLVDGLDEELGYFSLDELLDARGHFGLPVERDLYFEPRPLSCCYRAAREF